MLDSLFTSKMRVQILMRLFLNADSCAYLRELAKEFDASPSHVRSELQQLSSAGLLSRRKEGRQLVYRADLAHPLFPELQSMVRKALGMDQIVENILERLGKLEAAYLAGDYAEGRDSGIIDLILVGQIKQRNLTDLVNKTERYIKRKIRVLILTVDEFDDLKHELRKQSLLPLWSCDAAKFGSSGPNSVEEGGQ